jgi:hypothetical protein
MGNCVSDEQMRREQEHIENVQLHNRAVALYQYREKQYNFYIHGSFDQYMRQIAAQFELDCLPDDCKYGSNAERY